GTTRRASAMDVEVWRWIWIGAALFLALAEIVTAGFFMLPFGIGAAVAALLAWLDVAVAAQWVAFLGVSVVALFGLRRFVRFEDEDRPTVGATRFLNRRATVLEEIDRVKGTGRVRMETEEWRATTDANTSIPAGVEVRVTGVSGSRLIVAALDQMESTEEP
ncbi:MAG: NfeD family protein, partial [Acidimicrobiia bacterium]